MISITVIAGNGGNGCISFKRKKRRASIFSKIPNGSNGGDGGNVWLLADTSLNTLNHFYNNRIFRAENGQCGSRRGCTGKKGKDIIIKVPWGTKVIYQKTNKLLGNMGRYQKYLMVAKGGRHGLGNGQYNVSKVRLYREMDYNKTSGTKGELQHLLLELMLIADVGVFGLPNSGKSSFVRIVSAAKPKVASYPFTTLVPQLGVVQVNDNDRFIIADIPGIIKGAATGSGLGIRFLKHLEHCKILLHFVDIAPLDNSDPVANIIAIDRELINYGNKLICKPRWLIFNKIDLLNKYEAEKKVSYIIQALQWTERYYFISSIYYTNVLLLCRCIMEFIIVHRAQNLK